MHRVLVTGGAGFIGSHVTNSLIQRGHEVTVLDDLSGGFADNVPAGARFVQGSVTDDGLVDRMFAERGFDYVYHLAAYAAEGLSHFIKRFNYTNNVIGSVNLINASINTGVRGFVFTSSIAVYGASPIVPMTEETPPAPEDPYGIAKYAVERELASSREMFGLDYMIFRPHNVYGPGQNTGDRYRNVVGIFMNQILQGRPMSIFGAGTQTRAFSYIEDVAPVMAAAIDEPRAWNQVFNVGSDQPFTLNDLAHRVAAAMQVPAQVEHLPPRHEVQHAHASHEKLRRVFGSHETTSLNDGLRAMAAWVRARGVRSSAPFENIEIRKNLPGVWAGSGRTS
jgi:UDP-glucose 4-epimerase